MVKLFKILMQHKIPLFICAVLAGVSALFSVSLVLITKRAIDYAVNGNMKLMITYSLTFAAVSVLLIISSVVFKSIAEKLTAKIEIGLKNKAIKDFMHSEFSETEKFSDGDILNRLNGDAKITAYQAVRIPTVCVGAAVQLGGIVYVVSKTDARIVLMMTFLCTAVALFSALLRKKLKRLHKRQQEQDGKCVNFFRELIKNIEIVKVFDMYEGTEGKTKKLQEEYFDARMEKRDFAILCNTGMTAMFELCGVAVFFVALFGLVNGYVTVGGVFALIQIVGMMKNPISNISGIFSAYYTLSASYERLDELSRLKKEEKSIVGFANDYQSIVFENVYFKYGEEWILKDFSCEIPLDAVTVIEGESGIGKSTILKLIMGFRTPNQGRIYFKNCYDGTETDTRLLRNLFSYVPQGESMFSMSIEDNLKLACADAENEEVENALKFSRVHTLVSGLHGREGYVLGENGQTLSEGQMQRLAIARAYISKAPIMLMDEPTSALDELVEELLIDSINKCRDRTYIIVSHKQAVKRICDKVIRI